MKKMIQTVGVIGLVLSGFGFVGGCASDGAVRVQRSSDGFVSKTVVLVDHFSE